jgi:1-acyl-sn-glycerol-3-phosphate acyltransferase
MSSLSEKLEALLKEPGKAIANLIPQSAHQVRDLLSLKYDDRPLDEKYYDLHKHWLKPLHDHYFKVEHVGHIEETARLAQKERVILISNHANTLEAALTCYYFHQRQLGMVRTLVFKEAFRLPFVREFFKSGQCIPISVPSGKEALKKGHILVYPEGMDFIKHYMQKDFVVKFHKGFLRIAREYLLESGAKHVHVIPMGHDGIDYTIKFWVINNPFIVENFLKPYLGFPFFVWPKAPIVFPTHAIFNWGVPRKLTLDDLKDEQTMTKLSHEFRNDLLRLKGRARKLQKIEKAREPISSTP